MTETVFTPWQGLAGGALIGLGSAILMLASGKIAGISGILGRSFFPKSGDLSWRLAFLIALPIGAWLASGPDSESARMVFASRPSTLALGGLLVGIGTQLGNGCTSGHGVCGIARGSGRSVAATFTFMLAAAATVFVARHVIGIAP